MERAMSALLNHKLVVFVAVMGVWAGGVAAGGDARGQDQGQGLLLRVGEVDTDGGRFVLGNWLGDGAGLVNREGGKRGARFVIQLDGPMTLERRAALEGVGLELGAYLPANAYVVRLGGGAMEPVDVRAMNGLGFVRWGSAYMKAWKLAPELNELTRTKADSVNVVVTLFGKEDGAGVQQYVAKAGGRVGWMRDEGGHVTAGVELAGGFVEGLGDLDEVMFVEPMPAVELRARRNNTNRWVVQGDSVQQTPMYDAGIVGAGQVIGVLDSPVDQNHCSFAGQILAYNGSGLAHFHGTHVAATAMGDSGQNDNGRGVAYGSLLVWGPIPSFDEASIVGSLTLQHVSGARIHNNSWGNDATTAYDSLARGFDVFCYSNEMDFVSVSVTNTGTLKNPENAKNVLSVGASQDWPNQNDFCSGGTGPTADGRRKPEIFAPGCATQSATVGSACGTTGLTGTSMAGPVIAGAAALVREYFMEGFYPSGVATGTDSFEPSGVLVKAVLLNSAVDMTGVSGYPSDQEGWGRVRLRDAVYLADDVRGVVVRDVLNGQGLSTGQMTEVLINVLGNGGGEELGVTVAWTEPAASAGVSFAQVNDLDLEVVSPSGAVYLGNVFAGGESTTGGARDDRNNVEQVRIGVPEVGVWRVRVRGAGVAVGLQGYGLVVSGDVQMENSGVDVAVVSQVPSLVAPGQTVDVRARVRAGNDVLVGQSVTLSFSFDGKAYVTVMMQAAGGDEYVATVPWGQCGEVVDFYVSAEGVNSGVVTSPAGGMQSPASYGVGVITTIVSEDFEVDAGWTVQNDPSLTAGAWERGVPVGFGDRGDPPSDYDGSGMCWLTENLDGNSDVDGGPTLLETVDYDLSLFPEAQVSYLRWFFSHNGNDTLDVEISDDGGVSWAQLESITSNTNWVVSSFLITDYVNTMNQVRVRFSASDSPNNSIVEAGLDAFVIDEFVCVDVCAADFTGDGSLDVLDFFAFIVLFDSGDARADLNRDGGVDVLDFFELMVQFGKGCG